MTQDEIVSELVSIRQELLTAHKTDGVLKARGVEFALRRVERLLVALGRRLW